MKKEFIVERQGRSFVLYAGLLDMAHNAGLKSIRTELVQIPGEENNRVAIAVATVVLDREGRDYVFTGIGDAAPNNVAPAMQTCLIRMAETRAKARALRDAVNVGVAAFEELGDEGAHDGAPERGYAINGGRANTRTVVPVRAANGNGSVKNGPAKDLATPIPPEMRHPNAGGMTDAQSDAIQKLCRRRNLESAVVVKEKFGVDDLTKLSQAQASELIQSLNEPVHMRKAQV